MIKEPFKLETEDKLLISLFQNQHDNSSEIKIKNLSNQVNWEYLLKKASYHKMRPLLYSNLIKYPDQVPADIMCTLKDYYFINAQKNLLFMGELCRLVKIFKSENIPLIPYKGPILSIQAYGNISLREFGDIDIFIDKKDFNSVKRILLHENYETVMNLNESKESEYLKFQREYKFRNIANNILLEIQWNPIGFSFSLPNFSYFPVNNFKSISLNELDVETFTDEDLILILSIHVAGHMWSRLSWLFDLAELIKRSETIDWNQIMEKSHYLSIKRVLFLNLSLSKKLFNLEIPFEVQNYIDNEGIVEDLEKQVLKLIFTPEKVNIFNKIKLRFNLRENKMDGLKDILKIIIIPRSDEWSSFGDNNFSTKIMYFIKRPIQILRRIND